MGMRQRFNHVTKENEKLVPKVFIISLHSLIGLVLSVNQLLAYIYVHGGLVWLGWCLE